MNGAGDYGEDIFAALRERLRVPRHPLEEDDDMVFSPASSQGDAFKLGDAFKFVEEKEEQEEEHEQQQEDGDDEQYFLPAELSSEPSVYDTPVRNAGRCTPPTPILSFEDEDEGEGEGKEEDEDKEAASQEPCRTVPRGTKRVLLQGAEGSERRRKRRLTAKKCKHLENRQTHFDPSSPPMTMRDLIDLARCILEELREIYMNVNKLTRAEWDAVALPFIAKSLCKESIQAMQLPDFSKEIKERPMHVEVKKHYCYNRFRYAGTTLKKRSPTSTFGGKFRKKMRKHEAVWMRDLLLPFVNSMVEHARALGKGHLRKVSLSR